MSARIDSAVAARRAAHPTRRPWSNLLEREGTLGPILMFPAVAILALLIAYPFFLGIWYALTDARIGVPGTFVGLDNFIQAAQNGIFQQAMRNTFLYTAVTTAFKLALGLALALLMNQHFPLKNLVRAGLLLPWIIPTALSTLAWLWIFDSTYGIISWVLRNIGLIERSIPFLGDPTLAMGSVIAVNIWRGTPFFAISLLAALQTISRDLYEAAAMDGANAGQRFRHVTLPLIMPVLTIVTLFSVIWTFADFQLVYVLTRGGPTNSTHLLATLAYQIGMTAGELSMGAAISLWMFPFMAALVVATLWYQRRETGS
ncbi:MAG: sugar ABC transporter permease [Chloroflexota bacterium]|nr:sugar ABC transporter permease [Chloroflexota bacterium]